VGTGPEDLIRESFPTTKPIETMVHVANFFARHSVRSIGIGSFGPVNRLAGRIAATPKIPWQNFDLAEAVRKTTGVRNIAFDTDVNAAALGEHTWGAARGAGTFLYLTVGTGIGGGAMVNGRLLHGLSHPEMGHIRVPHDVVSDPFHGVCYAHGDCLEGLASGPAIEKRWGQSGQDLPAGHAAWELEAAYLALALANWICTLSPECIVLGGSVMRSVPLGLVKTKVETLLNGYLVRPEIVSPGLGDDAGVLGAIALGAALEA
jgi:fructokinase